MKYIKLKDGRIIDLQGYELDEETKDNYYFIDTEFNCAGIIVKKAKIEVLL